MIFSRNGIIHYLRRWNSSKATGESAFKQKLDEAEKAAQKKLPEWHKREESLRKRYGLWNPTRKLSRQQMIDIRELKKSAPHLKTVQLADHFNVNPESIRRILKSKWVPKDNELESILQRTEKRKQRSLERKTATVCPDANTSKLPSPGLQQKPAHHGAYQKDTKPWLKYKKRPDLLNKNENTPYQPRKPYTDSIGDLID